MGAEVALRYICSAVTYGHVEEKLLEGRMFKC